MHGLLSQPIPIIFVMVQGVQQLQDGSFNLLGIFDKLTVYRMPDDAEPASIGIQTVVVWTGGQGDFEQVLRIRDQDGTSVGEARMQFTLAQTAQRHYNLMVVAIPAREGVYTFTVSRGDEEEELMRQDFTIAFAQAPDASQ